MPATCDLQLTHSHTWQTWPVAYLAALYVVHDLLHNRRFQRDSQLQYHCWLGRLAGDTILPSPFLGFINLCFLSNKWPCLLRLSAVACVEKPYPCLIFLVVTGACWLGNPWETNQKKTMNEYQSSHGSLLSFLIMCNTSKGMCGAISIIMKSHWVPLHQN